MQKFRFLDWQVYKDSQGLFTEVVSVVKSLPKEYRFELGSQVIRSSQSIVLNIAEGSGKESDKELNRFLEIALGSAYETLACMDSLQKNEMLSEEQFEKMKHAIGVICSQIGGLKKTLKT